MSLQLEPGDEPIPGYKLIDILGSGGFGIVWKCVAPGGLFKAIKFVYGNLNTPDAEGIRAEQELSALERIKAVRHPFVLSMERIENIDGELVIVMELADKSLHDAYVECQAAGLVGIPRDALLRYMRDAAEALDHMTEKYNLLHLDVKPRNLFLISDRVKVADFGLVKNIERQNGSSMVGGVTPLYQPPETIHNKITPFSDQYSLAIVYQELLTGQRPFNGKNARQLALQHLNDEPELRLPEAERPVVGRALSKEPTKRWPNCMAFVRALYTARNPARFEVGPESGAAAANRPKTIADTMEDFLLEDGGHQPSILPSATPTRSPSPPPEIPEIEVSQLGITVAQPARGALRPTLLIGVGAFGRRALLELRCRFLDRFGDLDRIPLIRFLYVDSDAEAVKAATRGAPEVALAESAVHYLPLQSLSNYRKRTLDHINEWLPREKLYAIPKSLQTQGSRALGRLAFSDNHLRLQTRLRRELQQATHPDTLYKSVSQTGLALRENQPRVYVLAAAGGGGSGMLPDLGFTLRRIFAQSRFTDAETIAVLLCGSPNDPAMPAQEQANVYACLTELNHFTDPNVPFAAAYGPDSPRVQDEGRPFASTYLLQLPQRTPDALRDAVAHLGSYVFHDLTTPLGLRLDRSRHIRVPESTSVFRSFGTYAVWFPRGLLLRLASRQACVRLIALWQAPEGPPDLDLVDAAVHTIAQEAGLQFEAVCARIEETARLPGEGGSPDDALGEFLARLEEQSQLAVAHDDPGSWAGHALVRIQEWIGGSPAEDQTATPWKASRVGRAFANALTPLVKHWDQKLTETAAALFDAQGPRLANGEAALRRLQRLCGELAADPKKAVTQQSRATFQAWDQLVAACDHCQAGPSAFSFFGGRSRRQLHDFLQALTTFCRHRLEEILLASGGQFFTLLQARLTERLREFDFCRQRLQHLADSLSTPVEEDDLLARGRFGLDVTPTHTPAPSAESYWEAIRGSRTVRIVLPDGETDLERAARRFLDQLNPEHWGDLDRDLYDHVVTPQGGLHKVCSGTGDLIRNLTAPLIGQATAALEAILPVTDVASVEFSAVAAEGGDIQERARENFHKAAPLVAEADDANQEAFLLVPASDAGKRLADEIRGALPGMVDERIVRVPGQADLMYCREQGNLSFEELQRLLRVYRPAYEDLVYNPLTSPHSRFDVTDWVPLDP